MDEDDSLSYDPRLDDMKDSVDEAVSELRGIATSLRNRDRWTSLDVIWAVLFFGLITSWSGSKPDRFTDRCWYSVRYDTDWVNVNIQRRPSDCDFLNAPIGTKRCSYKKGTYIYGDDERRAAIGKATTEEDKLQASKQPNTVIVYWEKKDEP